MGIFLIDCINLIVLDVIFFTIAIHSSNSSYNRLSFVFVTTHTRVAFESFILFAFSLI